MNKVQFNIVGLQNPQMETQIKNALEKLDGVSMVHISMEESSVEVGYKEPAAESQIRHCIEHAGFKVE